MNKKYFRYFLILICSLTVLRLYLACSLGLGDDEAYYWEWTRHLDLGYFDHPPLIAYVISIFTSIIGKTVLAVRLGSILLFLGCSFLIYKISFEMFEDEQSAFYSVLLLNIAPIFSASAFMAFPDTPLGFLWLATLYVMYKIITTQKNWLWYITGILVGFGLLSKYNAILIAISIFIFLIFSKDNRVWLTRKEPYLGFLLTILIFSPVIYWNSNHDWISFGFQLTHRLKSDPNSLSIKKIAENTAFLLSSQLFYISPLIFIFSVSAIYISFKKGIKDLNDKYLLLSCFAIPTIILFNIAGIFKRTMPHWTSLGFISMFIILPELYKNSKYTKMKIATVAVAILLTGIVTIQTLYPLLPLKIKHDVTNDLYGWPTLAERAVVVKKSMDSSPQKTIWLTHFHLVASELAFYLPGNETVFNFNPSRISQYNFWFKDKEIKEQIGKNAVYINTNHYDDKPEESFMFDSCKLEETVKIYRAGKFAKSFDIYKIYNFKGVK